MSEEKKEPWLNYLALTTVILAVCATLATFKAGGHSSRSVLSQSQASDQWAYYQAKSVKLNLYEMNRAQLELERKALSPTASREVTAAYDAAIADSGKRAAKYEQEKSEIQDKARKLEQIRDNAQKHGGFFGIAVIFLQIAILLSSISALLKMKKVWLLGLGVGLFGVVYFLNGFFLFF